MYEKLLVGRRDVSDVKLSSLYKLTAQEYFDTDANILATHPVERALEHTNSASHDLDVEEFKCQRKMVLNFLEAQYNRIVKAEEDISPEWAQAIATSALILQDYTKALQRQLTPEIRALVLFYDNRYGNLDEEEELDKQLAWLTKAMKNRDWSEWQDKFITAGRIMSGQYLKIRKDRQKLFSCDRIATDHGCDIVVDEPGRDAEIKWWKGEMSQDELSSLGDKNDSEDEEGISKVVLEIRMARSTRSGGKSNRVSWDGHLDHSEF
ncbi:hypothetical protein BDZ45DRAFT_689125 [Acephala macrosclerotiorum]|nr:hypothetical protein BDZ45DRAFT_689125 [Acephala macrosclerotiorum]